MKNKIKELVKNKESKEIEYLNFWKRERADFLNYKKDEEYRVKKRIEYSEEKLILEIISILDNIYISEKNIPKELRDNDWIKGQMQIKSQIIDFLKNKGVEPIKSVGDRFNPEFHEAVEIIESDSESEIIINEIKKGYFLNGRVIRPAKVKISK